jgi:hypothetical protein
MTLSQLKIYLNEVNQLNFILPSGGTVPAHFHITAAGVTTKTLIDCGGTMRITNTIEFQLWVAGDTDHRLEPIQLKNIIAAASQIITDDTWEVEVEYQNESISRYGLDFDGKNFQLTNTYTDCLAKDRCGIPPTEKKSLLLAELEARPSKSCTPGSGCC